MITCEKMVFLVEKHFFLHSILASAVQSPPPFEPPGWRAMKKPSGKVVKAKVMKVTPKVMKASPKVMKAAKKPAVSAMSKPAAKDREKAPLPEKEKAAEEGEEGEEEEGEEDCVVDPKLTAKNVKTHQQLLSSKLCSAAEIDKAIGKLPQKEQQILWKKFEKERLLAGEDDKYKDNTKGLGSQQKKHKLLRSFVMDGGMLGKNYKTAMLTFEKTEEKGGETKFNTWKQQVDKYGKAEALARLKAGTMNFRKSPTDSRFLEFADQTEYYKWSTSKKQQVAYSTDKHKAEKDDWLSMENLALDDVGESSFGLTPSTLEDMQVEPELKEFLGQQLSAKGDEDKKEKKEKKEKTNKWEEMSTVTSSDTKDSLMKKLLAFKAELCKDEAVLQEAKLEMKGKADKKDELKMLTSTLQALQTCQKQVEKATAGGCKKELSKQALIACFAALGKVKKCKKILPGKSKKTKKRQMSEEEGSQEEED